MWNPSDPCWSAPAWPEWLTGFREHQKDAIAEVVTHFENGADVVLLNAPTGAGKTVIGEAVRRLMGQSALYVATTKTLQDQFLADFPYARVLKGRANYPTADRPELFDHPDIRVRLSAADCQKSFEELPACARCPVDEDADTVRRGWHCPTCHPIAACPYEQAKLAALTAPLAVLNTAYFLTEANNVGGFTITDERPDPLVILDECDTLENVLMSHVELRIAAKTVRHYGIRVLDAQKHEGVQSHAAWIKWVDTECTPKLHAARKKLADKWQVWDRQRAKRVWHNDTPADVRDEVKYIDGVLTRLRALKVDMQRENVVFDGYRNNEIVFKPIRLHHYGNEKVWRHGTRWLLMSATIIDPSEYVQSLGIEDAGLNWELVNVRSTFPPENRPIHVKSVANMTRKEKETAWPEMARAVQQVLAKHPDDRTLVHTVSYDLAQFLLDATSSNGRTLLTYKNAREREHALEMYRKTDGAVLFAPSMDRGVDLPEDDCRVVIVAKVPFPNMGDKQVKARMYSTGGQLWYSVQTVRSLVQMTGRGVRSAHDYCDIYVLDKQFMSNVWTKSKRLLPDWWTESIDWTGGAIHLT